MISFTCNGCGRSFSVPDEFAGRRAKCKSCGGDVVVPSAAAFSAPIENIEREIAVAAPLLQRDLPSPKIPLRVRRLMSDSKQMTDAFADFPLIKIRSTTGNPPDVYQLEYFVTSLERGKAGKPVRRESHLVEIQLTADYPRVAPHCKMLTPIFHPNIDPATICIGDHWTAGERLASLAVRIGEMLAYQAYNIQSPLDAEAAMWADLNKDQLPIDPRNLHPAEL